MSRRETSEERRAPAEHRVSRLSMVDTARLPEPARTILNQETERLGAPLNPSVVMAHHPAVLVAYKAFGKAMSDAALIPAALKYLLYVRVASLNGCPF
jgi:alkylhydroperoxidase family enzyme